MIDYSNPIPLAQLENLNRNWSAYDAKNQLKDFIYKVADAEFARGNAERDAIRDVKDITRRQQSIRKKFLASIGGLPASDAPLNPKVTGIVREDGFRIEKIIFESRPEVYVTANMYIPEDADAPCGTVQFLCGHHETSKHADEYQIVCRTLVKAGLVVFAQDPVGQGERISYYEPSLGTTTVRWGTGEHDYAGIQCLPLGQSIARYFVHDAMRGIDYLSTRPEVDKARIGVTGNSGGGTQTSLMMLCDDRIAAAAPGTYLMSSNGWMHTGGGQDLEQVWPGMTAAGFEHEDILLMMSPRPVLVLAASYDFFPIEATRWTVSRAKKFWDIHGKSENLEMFEQTVDHHYTREMAVKAAEFFSEHLLGKKVEVDNSVIQPIPPSRLCCTETGQLRGEVENARFVHEENVSNLNMLQKQRMSKPAKTLKTEALAWLKERIFFNRKPCRQNLRVINSGHCDDLCFNNIFWFSQENVINHALIFRDYRFIARKLPLTIAVWNDGTNRLQEHLGWLRRACAHGRAVMALNVSGVGAIEPLPINARALHTWYGTVSCLANDLLWLGDSLAAFRAYDVVRALDVVREIPDIVTDETEVYGCGSHGVYALLAAAVDSRIKLLLEVQAISSFAEFISSRHYDDYDISSVVLPGIQHYCDLPDIRNWKDDLFRA